MFLILKHTHTPSWEILQPNNERAFQEVFGCPSSGHIHFKIYFLWQNIILNYNLRSRCIWDRFPD